MLRGDGDDGVEVRDLRAPLAVPQESAKQESAKQESAPAPETATPGTAPAYRPPVLPPMHEMVERCETTDGFRVARHKGLASLDYTYATRDSWTDPLLRECRGLLYDEPTGAVAARPLHKFFNWGEEEAVDRGLDFAEPHEVAEKRDGTLFYPAERSDGTVLWCTRAGETDLAKALAADLPPAPALRHREDPAPLGGRRTCDAAVRAHERLEPHRRRVRNDRDHVARLTRPGERALLAARRDGASGGAREGQAWRRCAHRAGRRPVDRRHGRRTRSRAHRAREGRRR